MSYIIVIVITVSAVQSFKVFWLIYFSCCSGTGGGSVKQCLSVEHRDPQLRRPLVSTAQKKTSR